MSDRWPFDWEPDADMGRALREQLTGPHPDAFLARLRVQLAALIEERENQWEVLAHWARPGVLAAAVAAAFLLGATLWRHWADRERQAGTSIPVAAVEAAQPVGQALVWNSVLEER
jgi:hypothetical protein